MLSEENDTDWVTFGLIAGFLTLMVIFALFVVYFATGIRNVVDRLRRKGGIKSIKSATSSENSKDSEDSARTEAKLEV